MKLTRWTSVKGYEGYYKVSEDGIVSSVSRAGRPGTGNGAKKGMVLGKGKGYSGVASNGYRTVTLCRDGICKTHTVHTVVYRSFVGEVPEGHLIRHLNDDRHDNRLCNLTHGSYRDNYDDSKTNGCDMISRGTHYLANLKECKRGHKLGAPNVLPSQAKKGQRACLACGRALGYIKSVKRRKGVDLSGSIQEISDSYYDSIKEQA